MSISHSHFCFLLFLLSCNCLYPYPTSKVNINTKLLHIAELVIKYFQFRMGGHTTKSLKQHGLQVLDPFHHIALTGLLCLILPIGEGSDSLRGFRGAIFVLGQIQLNLARESGSSHLIKHSVLNHKTYLYFIGYFLTRRENI